MPESPQIPLPEPLADRADERWRAFVAAAAGLDPAWSAPAGLESEARRVFAFSDFVSAACIGDPAQLCDLIDSGDLLKAYPPDRIARSLSTALSALTDIGADPAGGLGTALRRFRRREMVRIAWRDLSGRSDLEETLADLSALADACIDCALERLHRAQCASTGPPEPVDGCPSGLSTLSAVLNQMGAFRQNQKI